MFVLFLIINTLYLSFFLHLNLYIFDTDRLFGAYNRATNSLFVTIIVFKLLLFSMKPSSQPIAMCVHMLAATTKVLGTTHYIEVLQSMFVIQPPDMGFGLRNMDSSQLSSCDRPTVRLIHTCTLICIPTELHFLHD